MKKAEAKPVAAEKRKNEKSDGKVVPGPASKKPPRRSKESFPVPSAGRICPKPPGETERRRRVVPRFS